MYLSCLVESMSGSCTPSCSPLLPLCFIATSYSHKLKCCRRLESICYVIHTSYQVTLQHGLCIIDPPSLMSVHVYTDVVGIGVVGSAVEGFVHDTRVPVGDTEAGAYSGGHVVGGRRVGVAWGAGV